ncbi:MAG: hypothetical protein RRC07_07155 [Anaerolineae bacterium]|nr:hypothetical protein [Anaerolineae bacterium]
MANDLSASASHLFTLRLWVEELGDGRAEWRGQLTYLPSGETHYLRRWDQLQETMRHCLPGFELAQQEPLPASGERVAGGDEAS